MSKKALPFNLTLLELLELNDNTFVLALIDIIGNEINKDVSMYKQFEQNRVTTVKDLRRDLTLASWNKWSLLSKLADSFKSKIQFNERSIRVNVEKVNFEVTPEMKGMILFLPIQSSFLLTRPIC